MKTYTLTSNNKITCFLSSLLLVVFFVILPFSSHAEEVTLDFERLQPVTKNISEPVAVALDKTGRLYVADAYFNSVVVLNQSGKYISKLTGLGSPISVAVDTSGRIFVGNKNRGNVEVYDADFNLLFKLGSGDGEFVHPNDITIDAATGGIYVVDKGNNIVRIYDSSGQPMQPNGSIGSPGNGDGQFNHPLSIAIDKAAGEIIVLDRQFVPGTTREGSRVQFFNMAGNFLRSFNKNGDQVGDLFRPQNITVDKASRVYVSDSRQNVVLLYSNTGDYLGAVFDMDNPMRVPLGIAIDRTNRLYVSSRMAKCIDVYGIEKYTNMVVNPVKLNFTAKDGGENPPSKSMSIQNGGTITINWGAVVNDGWLSLSDDYGMLRQGQNAASDVAVDITGLAPGEYLGSITVSAGPETTEVVQVALTVKPVALAKLLATPTTLSFTSEVGTTPLPEKITIANTGSAPLDWTISADQGWISVSQSSGTITDGEPGSDVTVLADVTSLGAGIYTGTITVTGQGVQDSPVLIDVTLTLTDPVSEPPATPPPGTIWPGNFGRKWTVVAQLDGTSLNGIWGSSWSDIFVVGDSGTVLHYNYGNWKEEDVNTSLNLYAVWGTSASNVYAVGESGLVLHYDGENWSDASPAFTGVLRNVWCSDKSNCITVGQNASILTRSNVVSPWSLEYSLEYFGSLRGVWGSSGSDVYAVGDFGTILHNDGSKWDLVDSGTYANLQDIWGNAADNIFAVGQDGLVLHYNGTSWTPMNSGVDVTLRGIWGNNASEVYAVGDDGTMLLYKGSQWRQLESGIAEDLNDVWSGMRREVYAVGSEGSVILSRNPFPWWMLHPAFSHNGKQVKLQKP